MFNEGGIEKSLRNGYSDGKMGYGGVGLKIRLISTDYQENGI